MPIHAAGPRGMGSRRRGARRERAARQGHGVVRGPQRAHRHRPLAVRHQRARRRARDDQRRLPRARARPREPARSSATRRVDQVLLEGGRAVGVRARIGGEWVDVRADQRRPVRRRDPLARDPAALRASARTARSPGCRSARACRSTRSRCSGCSTGPDAAPGRSTQRQANCCLRYSSGLEGAGENDMMIVSVNQTLALPGRRHLAPGRRGPGGRDVGRRRRRRGARWVPACCASGSTSSSAAAGCTLASPDPDVHPLIDQDLLNVEADLVRMRDGVKRSLDLLRSGAFDSAFGRIAIDMTGPRARRALRRRRRSTRG